MFFSKRRYLSKLHGTSELLSDPRENHTSNREVVLQVNTEKNRKINKVGSEVLTAVVMKPSAI
jgi:hypothetical protein